MASDGPDVLGAEGTTKSKVVFLRLIGDERRVSLAVVGSIERLGELGARYEVSLAILELC